MTTDPTGTASGDRYPGCFSCDEDAALDRLPVRSRIAVDRSWRVVHAVDSALPGWLVLVPRRHVTAVADLTDAEAVGLGTWPVRLSRALHAVTGCAKTYVVQFAEAPGFSHVHVHVVPRAADLAPEHRGPGVFALLGRPVGEAVPADVQDALATALRAALGEPDTGPEPGAQDAAGRGAGRHRNGHSGDAPTAIPELPEHPTGTAP